MALTTEGLGFIGSNFSNNYVKLRGKVTIFDYLDLRSGGSIYYFKGIVDSLKLYNRVFS